MANEDEAWDDPGALFQIEEPTAPSRSVRASAICIQARSMR